MRSSKRLVVARMHTNTSHTARTALRASRTYGGVFDSGTGHYLSNVVVYTALVAQ